MTTTIADFVAGDPQYSILEDVVVYLDTTLGTELAATLDDPDAELTLFAPTNAAFGDLAVDLGYTGDPADTGDVTTFLVDNVAAETLLDIVLYHVSPTTQLSGDVAASDTIDTLGGETITVDLPTLVDNEPDLIDPSLVSVDNVTDNGVVHGIDKVLLPVDLAGNDAPTITGIVAASGDGFDHDNEDFDILLTALNTAGLAGTLDDTNLDATVFAPTDAAFIGLANGLGYHGSDEEGAWTYLVEALALLNGGDAVSLLTDVLTYHVSGESLQASQVLASDEIGTLQGGTIGVDGTTLVDGEPDIADPTLIATDIQASNGVVHVIDGVLLPVDLLPSDGSDDVDFIIGGKGDSRTNLGADNDFLDANEGDDDAFGGAGNDVIFGGDDDDRLGGGKGDDAIYGGADDDLIAGGAGKDTIEGGTGDDILIGGAKSDVFVFSAGDDEDVILDFHAGTDLIDLSAYGFHGFEDIEHDISTKGHDIEIHLGSGDEIVLKGAAGTHLDAHDFIF